MVTNKKEVTKEVTMEEITSVECDVCGTKFGNNIPTVSITELFSYVKCPKLEGMVWDLDICEDCIVKMVKKHKLGRLV